MPFNALTNLTTGIINTAVEGSQAAKNLEWQKEMFQRQQDFEKLMAEDAQAFEKEEAELAYQREVEMWNMQNEYNSPTEQMRRYKDAGLNPWLIYGQGTPGNATDMPKYSPTKATKPQTLTPPQLPTFRSSLPTNLNVLEGRQILSQVEVNKQQEDFLNAQTANTDEKTVGQAIDNAYKVAHHEKDLALKDIQFQLNAGLIDKNKADTEYRRIQSEFEKRTNKYREKYLSGQNDLQNVEIRDKEKGIALKEKDLAMKDALLSEIKAKTQGIQNANQRAEIEYNMLVDNYNTQRVINAVKQLTGRDSLGNDPMSLIMGLLARGQVSVQQILGQF
jgi:hypothetical protein